MTSQSDMLPLDDGTQIFDAATLGIEIQRIVDISTGPDLQATVRELPDLIGRGYKAVEAYINLLMKIEKHYQTALDAGLPFPEPLLD